MPLAIADQPETRTLWVLRMHQIHLAKPRHHAHLEQQPADAGVPGAINAVKPLERTAWLRRG